MKQRTPMNRGKGFRRPARATAKTFESSKNRNSQADPATAESEAAYALAGDTPTVNQQVRAAVRMGTYTSSQTFVSAPKNPRAENPHLLNMARGKPCLIRSPICNYDSETTVACHGGGVANGKGLGYKVSDALTCWGCSACNHYTDAYGGASKEQKQHAFMLGHLAQIDEWQAIAISAAADPKDRLAARWALMQLNVETP